MQYRVQYRPGLGCDNYDAPGCPVTGTPIAIAESMHSANRTLGRLLFSCQSDRAT